MSAITGAEAMRNAIGVEIQAAIADLAGGADLAATIAKVNAILAALRLANIIAT